jgi:hypothetical protein
VNGVVDALSISPNEAVTLLNTSSRHFPSLATRPGMLSLYGSVASPLSSINGAGVRNGSILHVQNGTAWKYWDSGTLAWVDVVASGGLTAAKAKILEFNTAAARNTILVNGTNKKYWTGSGAASDITDGPATRLYAPDDSRMYAFKYPYIYCSAAGTIMDWTTLGDADKIILTGMIGEETAFVIFNDMKIGWSDQTMHILLGKVPDEFDPSEPILCGNISDRATLIHGKSGTLYWMDYNKFMAFTGGMPFDVSQRARNYLENVNFAYKQNICAGQWGKYIYISMPWNGSTTNNLTLEFDTENNTWYPWDVGFVNFVNIGDDLIGITTGGVVKQLNYGTVDDATAIAWEHITGAYDVSPVRNLKTMAKLNCVAYVPIGSTMNVSFSTSLTGSSFTSLYDFVPAVGEQNVQIRIPTNYLQHVNYYRLKISGTGHCRMYMIDPDIRIIA